jgi:ubiquinone/menaquinone biosynthesis C-methylase UbiE
MSEQTHHSDPRVLNERTLAADHRRLAALLRPGMYVLDVGCGTGAITAGIARAVAPDGRVWGIDRDQSLLEIAGRNHRGIPNLSLEYGDALTMTFERAFDLVTAARTLQWINRPADAIARMCRATKTGGRIVALDYNHQNNRWDPQPPAEFRRFYEALLAWREANGWDNLMAEHLPQLFRDAGMVDIHVYIDDETALRDEPQANIWTNVIESIGPQLVTAGFLEASERDQAQQRYREWARISLERQTLELRTVVGTVV